MHVQSNIVPRAFFPASKAREKRPKDEVVFEGKEWGNNFTNFACLWSNFWKYNTTRHIEKHSEHNRKVVKKAWALIIIELHSFLLILWVNTNLPRSSATRFDVFWKTCTSFIQIKTRHLMLTEFNRGAEINVYLRNQRTLPSLFHTVNLLVMLQFLYYFVLRSLDYHDIYMLL